MLNFSVVFAEAPSSCSDFFDKQIEEQSNQYIKNLSSALTAHTQKSATVENTGKHFRILHCKLEKICEGVSTNIQQKLEVNKKLSLEKKDKIELIFKKQGCQDEVFSENELQCIATTKSVNNASGFQEYTQCKKKISEAENRIMQFTQQKYLEASQQDEGNYYSAKILSLTVRLKDLADMFVSLGNKIQSVYQKINCSC